MENLNQIYTTIKNKQEVYESIAQKSHGVDEAMSKRIIEAELETYMNRLSLYIGDPMHVKDGGQPPTISIAQGVNIFLEVIQGGLSFSSVANHVYLSRLKGTGQSVGYQVTADGWIYQAQRAGAISHMSEAVIVQRGEVFSIVNTPDGKHIAQHQMFFDGKPKFNLENFVVGYVYVTYPDGSRELHWIGAERMKELRSKSSKQSMYNDESFIQTKIIKHALRKVRKSPFMQAIQNDDDDVIQQHRMYEQMEAMPQPQIPQQQIQPQIPQPQIPQPQIPQQQIQPQQPQQFYEPF